MRGHVLKCIQRGGGGGVGHQGVKKNSLHPVKCCLMRMEAGNNSGSVITRIVPLN